jgi:hypothetical protein
MVAIDIVHELPNPYDRLKLEIVGSCFALHRAKRSSLSTGSKQKLALIVSRILGSNPREWGLHHIVFACLLAFRSALPTFVPPHQTRFALAARVKRSPQRE